MGSKASPAKAGDTENLLSAAAPGPSGKSTREKPASLRVLSRSGVCRLLSKRFWKAADRVSLQSLERKKQYGPHDCSPTSCKALDGCAHHTVPIHLHLREVKSQLREGNRVEHTCAAGGSGALTHTRSYRVLSSPSSISGTDVAKKCWDLSSRFFMPIVDRNSLYLNT